MERTIQAPFTKETAESLKAGDYIYIDGIIYTARDAAHKRMIETLDEGKELPVEIKDTVIYYMGPSPAREGRVIGSAGPTTSGRMDAYTPTMLEQGIKGMVGKGSRSAAVVESMKKNGVTYFAAVGGAAALIAKSVKKYEVVGYPELGPEAVAKLTVEDFPCIVVIDSEGNNFYEMGQKPYRKL